MVLLGAPSTGGSGSSLLKEYDFIGLSQGELIANQRVDGDHKDGPTIGKIRLPTRAATPHFQSGEPPGSAYGVPKDFR